MLVRRIASEHLCSTASHSKGNVIMQKIADRRAHSDLEEATGKGSRLWTALKACTTEMDSTYCFMVFFKHLLKSIMYLTMLEGSYCWLFDWTMDIPKFQNDCDDSDFHLFLPTYELKRMLKYIINFIGKWIFSYIRRWSMLFMSELNISGKVQWQQRALMMGSGPWPFIHNLNFEAQPSNFQVPMLLCYDYSTWKNILIDASCAIV